MFKSISVKAVKIICKMFKSISVKAVKIICKMFRSMSVIKMMRKSQHAILKQFKGKIN